MDVAPSGERKLVGLEYWSKPRLEQVVQRQLESFSQGYTPIPVEVASPEEWLGQGKERDLNCRNFVNANPDNGYSTPVHLQHPDRSLSHVIGTNGLVIARSEEPIVSVQHARCGLVELTAQHPSAENSSLRVANHVLAGDREGRELRDNVLSFIAALKKAGFNLTAGNVYRWDANPDENETLLRSIAQIAERAELPIDPRLLLSGENVFDYDIKLTSQGYSITHLDRRTPGRQLPLHR